MKLSVVIPVFNEEKTLKKLCQRVVLAAEKLAKQEQISDWEIIIVDDGSRDSSPKIIKKLNQKKINAYFQKNNQGKGAAIRKGFSLASGDILLIQDADLEYDPKYYGKLIKPILDNQAAVVFGSRLSQLPLNLRNITQIKLPLHFISNKLLSWLTSLLYGQKITDMETGYKVLTREVLEKLDLQTSGFEIEVELTAQITKAGYQIYEVPITTKPRGYEEGKKIGFADGVQAIFDLFRYKIELYHVAILGVLILALILRLWNLHERYSFGSDQARDVFVGRVANQTFTPPLIGNFSSVARLTFGPIWYYYAMLVDALPGAHLNYWIGLGVLSTLMIFGLMMIARRIWGRFASLAVGVLGAISLASIDSSLSATQESLVPICVTGFLFFALKNLKHKSVWSFFWTGLFLSAAINAHYQGVYLLPMLLLLIWYKRSPIKHWMYLVFGLLIPLVPMILFDIQHKWWNLYQIADYYRFGQYQIFVPNRWLTYVGQFWPGYWSRVVGGGYLYAFGSMVGIGLLFWYQLFKKKLKSETVLIFSGFFIAFIAFKYFRAERNFDYVTFSIPFILLLTTWLIDYLYKLDKMLGIAVFSLFALGGYFSLLNNSTQNSFQAINFLRRYLVTVNSAQAFAVYDSSFANTECSIPLSLLLDDSQMSAKDGYRVGICQTGACGQNNKVLTAVPVSGFECQLVDLEGLSEEELEANSWVLVSPMEVYRMTVNWWKTEPKLMD